MQSTKGTSHFEEVNGLGACLVQLVVGAQGIYFFVFGAWPIIDIHSFQAVTGPKTDHLATGNENDHWLVLTVGALITVIGATLLIAAYFRHYSLEIAFLAGTSAIALATIEVIYVYRKVIAPIYLADAAIELLFCLFWIVYALRARFQRSIR
jgi:hypothetical protein